MQTEIYFFPYEKLSCNIDLTSFIRQYASRLQPLKFIHSPRNKLYCFNLVSDSIP